MPHTEALPPEYQLERGLRVKVRRNVTSPPPVALGNGAYKIERFWPGHDKNKNKRVIDDLSLKRVHKKETINDARSGVSL